MTKFMTRSIALMLLFWAVAALLVAATPAALEPASPLMAILVKVAAIAVVAFGFVKVSRHPASLHQALVVGVIWLLLAVVTELVVTTNTGHAWFGLLGPPEAASQRALMLLAWIAAPAFFVRRLTSR